jgi:hypothetical protein
MLHYPRTKKRVPNFYYAPYRPANGTRLKKHIALIKGSKKIKPWKLFNKTALERQAYVQFGFQIKHPVFQLFNLTPY